MHFLLEFPTSVWYFDDVIKVKKLLKQKRLKCEKNNE